MELRDVVGHPGYFVGDDGSVWTAKLKGGTDRTPGRRGDLRPLAVQVGTRGYLQVNLDVRGRNKSRFVHQLVLEAFVGPKPDGQEGCHYPDHDKRNNRLRNLRWDMHAENVKDAYRDRPPAVAKVCRRCGFPKLVSQFYRDKRASDGLQTECKSCHNSVSVATRDPEKKRAANRAHMRRVRG
jgi:hypothetical protein